MKKRCDNVSEALSLAAEEINQLSGSLRERGAEAFRTGQGQEFERIKAQCELADRFTNEFQALRDSWQKVCAEVTRKARHRKTHGKASRTPRAAKDEILQEQAYIFPILSVIQGAGGRAHKTHIVEQVGKELHSKLLPRDFEPLATGQLRWQNRIGWCRSYLARAGYLSGDSPRGIWEITQKGQRALKTGDIAEVWNSCMEAKSAASLH